MTDADAYQSSIFPQHADLLRASSIPTAVAAERGYMSVDTKARLKGLGFSEGQRSVPGLLIPIWNAAGEVALHQYRPDTPRERDGKLVKYETPLKARMVLDVPPRAREWIDDPARPLFITEGARKADAAAAAGLCCVALLGVWNWRGTNAKGGSTVLADWEMVALKSRDVFLAFDSDVVTKPEVCHALHRLAGFLDTRGASVQVILLPSGDGGVKAGLDDYLAAGHSVDDLLGLARPELPAPVEREKPKPAPGPAVDLVRLLDDVAGVYRRYVVMTQEQADTTALHVAHTHVIRCFETTPYRHMKSAEMRSGKSTTLKLDLELVARPRASLNISDAAVYRLVDSYPESDPPTFVMDEVDRVFYASRGGEQSRPELAGLINGGFQRGPLGHATRMVGEGSNLEAKDFRTFSPKVLAGIRDLPGTVGDRSIPIVLKRKAPGETVERFRIRRVRAETAPIRERLEAWAQSAGVEALADAEPVMPPGLHDREEDLWEPLLAVADLAGGDWPARARAAATSISRAAVVADESSTGIQLLADIRTVFADKSVDRLATAELLEALCELEESSWATWSRGNPISKRKVGVLLNPYGVRPKTLRVGTTTPRGYERDAFEDAWARYCPSQDERTATTRNNPHGYAENTGSEKCNTDADVALPEQAANPHGYADVADCGTLNGQDGPEPGRDAPIDAGQKAQLGAISMAQLVIDRLTLLEQWDVLKGVDGYPTTETAWRDYCATAITDADPDRLREAMQLIGTHRTVWVR
jgi:hypothetical protein